MARVGDKFIIEIESIYGVHTNVKGTDVSKVPDELYRIKGFNSLVFDQNGIEKLQKYEPQLTREDLEKARQEDREEAWEYVKKIVLTPIGWNVSKRIFNNESSNKERELNEQKRND